MKFPAQLEDGTIIEVQKVHEGDGIVLKDEDGKRYQGAQFGSHIVPLDDDEAPVKEEETDTEPVAEEGEPETPEEEGAAGEEEAGEGGANEEPMG